MSLPDFDQLCDELNDAGVADAHPAELHGLACGILAAGFQPSTSHWLREAADYTDQPALLDQAPLLSTLYDVSRHQLIEGDFSFQLCLPDDEIYDLPERSESLAQWCQGFLHGFAAIQSPLNDEGRELLQDLTEISRLEFDTLNPDEPEEEDELEGYYTELAEFVRMAAISLFMDYSRPAETAGSKPHARH